MMEKAGYTRSVHRYDIPNLTLLDDRGEKTSLQEALDSGRPVLLNFIFTSCTTICPLLSATFGQVQEDLGEERKQVRMISITIDPEYDTPERLRAYGTRFHAGQQWSFLTGAPQDIVSVQKAFDAYRGGKTNHEPLTFLRGASDEPWVRLDGVTPAADVIRELKQLTGG